MVHRRDFAVTSKACPHGKHGHSQAPECTQFHFGQSWRPFQPFLALAHIRIGANPPPPHGARLWWFCVSRNLHLPRCTRPSSMYVSSPIESHITRAMLFTSFVGWQWCACMRGHACVCTLTVACTRSSQSTQLKHSATLASGMSTNATLWGRRTIGASTGTNNGFSKEDSVTGSPRMYNVLELSPPVPFAVPDR